jgi:hypothetical protein
VFALGIAVPTLPAQQPLVRTTLDSGTVVRLHLNTGDAEAGRLLAPFATDSTTFRFCRFPAPPCSGPAGPRYAERLVADVRSVDRHTGTRWKRGALVGAVIGTTWVVSLFASGADCFPDLAGISRVGACATSIGGFISIPALVGAIVGSGWHTWRPMEAEGPG